MKSVFKFFLLLILACSCHSGGKNDVLTDVSDTLSTIPDGFCPFVCIDNGMYITGTLNDSIDALLLFDTGADGLLLDSSFAIAHHLHYNPKIKVNMINATIPIYVYSGKTSLNLCTENFDFELIPMFNQRQIFGEHIDGTIGWMPFREKILHVNFDHLCFAISDTSPDSIKNSWHSIDLIHKNFRFYVQTSIEFDDGNLLNGLLMIDFGHSGTFDVTPDIYKTIDVPMEKKLTFKTGNINVKGTKNLDVIKSRKIKMGNIVFNNPHLYVPDHVEQNQKEDVNILGKIGYEALAAMGEIIVDFKEKKLFYHPEKCSNIKFENFKTPGIMFIQSSKVEENRVTAVETSCSDQIQIGDVVLEIDGHSPTDEHFDIKQYVLSKKGTVITYKILKQNGEMVNVKLPIRQL